MGANHPVSIADDPGQIVKPSFIVPVLLTGLAGLPPLSIDMFLPSMPAMAKQFQTDPVQIQLAVTLFLMSLGFSQLFFGPLSDRFGRRPIMLVGLAGYALAGLGCVFAPTIEVLILGRVIQGFAAGSGPAVSRAIVRDIYGKKQAAKIMAYMATAIALAPILAPMLGGFLQVWFGWQSVFALLFVMGSLFFLTYLLVLPETNQLMDVSALQARQLVANYGQLLTDRRYVGYTLLMSVFFCGILAFITNSSFVLINGLGVSPKVYGFCFGLMAVGLMIGAFLAGRLADKFPHDVLIQAGTLIASGAGLLMAGLALGGVFSVMSIVGPMFFFALGGGLARPLAMAGAIVPYPEKAGLASALMGFVQMGSASLFAMVFGHLYSGTALPMVLAISGAGVLTLLVYRGFVKPVVDREAI